MVTVAIADIHVQKVASHDNPLSSTGPLDDFVRTWNNCADSQAGLKNEAWPSFLLRVRDKYVAYRHYWGGLLRDLVSFHLEVAGVDCEKLESQAENEDPQEENNPGPEFVWTPNAAAFSLHLVPLQQGAESFGSKHDVTFRAVYRKLLNWLVQEDSSAANMRTVSLLELYAGFRLSIDGRCYLVCFGGVESVFDTVTFARDFDFFKKVFRFICQKAEILWMTDRISLNHLSIFIPSPAVQFGFRSALDSEVSLALRTFVGDRPVATSQGFSKPWRP